MYSSTLSLTSAIGIDGWSTPRTGRFTIPILKQADWIPRQVWTGEEYLDSQRDSIPGLSSPQRAAIPSTQAQPCLEKTDRKSNLKFRVLFQGGASRGSKNHRTRMLCYGIEKQILLDLAADIASDPRRIKSCTSNVYLNTFIIFGVEQCERCKKQGFPLPSHHV